MKKLVTFCGMVGSGKTTNSKKTLRWLCQAGYEPYYLRFRSVGWRSLLRPPALSPWQDRESHGSRPDRRSASRKAPRHLQATKSLSLLLTLGYLVRAMRFRLFCFLYHRHHLVVVNRYFYDSFAHYHLATASERRYLRWLMAAIPRPELAVLLVLRPETAHRRKPFYNVEELRQCAENVAAFQRLVPNLKIVATDNIATIDRQVEKHLREIFPQQRKREHVQEGYPQN